jgi:hypothetical protein
MAVFLIASGLGFCPDLPGAGMLPDYSANLLPIPHSI